jgi:hypothetical protein
MLVCVCVCVYIQFIFYVYGSELNKSVYATLSRKCLTYCQKRIYALVERDR